MTTTTFRTPSPYKLNISLLGAPDDIPSRGSMRGRAQRTEGGSTISWFLKRHNDSAMASDPLGRLHRPMISKDTIQRLKSSHGLARTMARPATDVRNKNGYVTLLTTSSGPKPSLRDELFSFNGIRWSGPTIHAHRPKRGPFYSHFVGGEQPLVRPRPQRMMTGHVGMPRACTCHRMLGQSRLRVVWWKAVQARTYKFSK
jgi:hypothetical protein